VYTLNQEGYGRQGVELSAEGPWANDTKDPLTTERMVRLMEAYCVKCKAKKEMKEAKAVTMKNGKPATQGLCPTCGTKMFKIGKA